MCFGRGGGGGRGGREGEGGGRFDLISSHSPGACLGNFVASGSWDQTPGQGHPSGVRLKNIEATLGWRLEDTLSQLLAAAGNNPGASGTICNCSGYMRLRRARISFLEKSLKGASRESGDRPHSGPREVDSKKPANPPEIISFA